jgi:hypothetical protein
MSVITIPKPLREKLGDEASDAFVEVIKEIEKKDEIVTKDFLERRLAELKTDLLKWMFLFWIGQIAVIVAILKLMFK